MNPKVLPDIKDFKVETPVQIRFNDIDILGHVNNTVYFSFYDTGKAFYFNAVKGGKMNWQKVETVIANIDCAFIRPVHFGDDIAVLTRCVAIHEKSFILRQAILERKSGEICSLADTVMVTFDPDSLKPVPVTDEWRGMIRRLEEDDSL